MKKVLCTLLALVMILGCAFALTACSKDDGDKENKIPTIPEGYQKITVDDIAFACPENWKRQDSSVILYTNSSGKGNNITVAHTKKDDTFEDMTVEKFKTLMKSNYQTANMALRNLSIENVESNGLSVLKISYSIRSLGISMSQTIFVTNLGDETYIVTVSAMSPNGKLVTTVLETLHAVK